LLDPSALAHSRYQRQSLSEDQWLTWDRNFAHMYSDEPEAISRSRWEELQHGIDSDFWQHVGRVLFSGELNGP